MCWISDCCDFEDGKAGSRYSKKGCGRVNKNTEAGNLGKNEECEVGTGKADRWRNMEESFEDCKKTYIGRVGYRIHWIKWGSVSVKV